MPNPTQSNRARAAAGLRTAAPDIPPLETRAPTGLPSWPIIALTGAEKSGKTYDAAEASASPLIGRTFWISCGEDDPDEYGAIPGARFEIVLHDGSYRGILNALRAARAVPRTDGKPNLIVFDSGGRAWLMLADMAQVEQTRRAIAKARRANPPQPEPNPDDISDINMDLWNTANQRWAHLLGELRMHDGPSIITARLELTTIMLNGQPTNQKAQKIQAQKNLAFDVGGIVEKPSRGETFVRGLRSLRLDVDGLTPFPDFTMHKLWVAMGLDAEAKQIGERIHVEVDPEAPRTDAELALEDLRAVALVKGWDLVKIADEWKSQTDGGSLKDCTNAKAIARFTEELIENWPALIGAQQ